MERDEEHRVVAAEDRLRAVAVVHVVVDDRDPREPELRLRVARRDRHVVEHAEAHRAVGERVVAGRPDEREAAAIDRLQGDPGREHGSLPRRLGRDGVAVEEERQLDRLQEREVIGRVHARQLLVRRPPLDGLAAEPQQPLLPLRMLVPSDAGAPERGFVRSSTVASRRPASRPRPHSSASAAARPHVGSWSSSAGSGASSSIVAMWR